ncbi:hypothetical protein [Intestinibacter sp.]
MGKQINFYMDKKLEEEFFQFVKKDNLVLFEDENGKLISIDKLPPKEVRWSGFLYICSKEVGDYILSNNLEYSYKLEVIEFSRSIVYPETKHISGGRLYVISSYFNENEELIYRGEQVNKLYQKLCRWIRKRIPKKEFMKNNYLSKEYISESLIPLAEKEGYHLY